MRILPKTDLARVEFFEQHNAAWMTNAAAIGLTPAQVSALSAATAAARSAYTAQQVAQDAARAATLKFHTLALAMADLGADAVKAVKLKAATGNDPNVFVLAQIPPPSQPAPPPPLEAPTGLVSDPNADGTISLSWEGSVKFRTFFSIWRKVGAAGAWTNLGSTAARSFTDAGLPRPVPASISYAVRSQRGDAISGPSGFAEVAFGGAGSASRLGAAGAIAADAWMDRRAA